MFKQFVKKYVEVRHYSVKSSKIGEKLSSDSNFLLLVTNSRTESFVKSDIISKLTKKSKRSKKKVYNN